MSKINKYIPKYCYKSIYNVDYNKLYEEGKRIILFDLDNTIAPYDVFTPTEDVKQFLNNIEQMGFKIGIISNNHKKRVQIYMKELNYHYTWMALKPHTFGYKKIMKLFENIKKEEVVSIGDQMMTDVLGSNRIGIDSILVKPIKKKNEKWFTKLNRYKAKKILKKIEKVNNEIYQQIIDINKE